MGEVAEMVTTGDACSNCYRYMPDVGEGFPRKCDDCANEKYEKRGRNLAWSTNHLIEQGIEFQSFNNGIHLRVKRPAGLIDFWPSTGKFKRPNGTYGRGIKNMLKETAQPIEEKS